MKKGDFPLCRAFEPAVPPAGVVSWCVRWRPGLTTIGIPAG
jgi:hypothetical protein